MCAHTVSGIPALSKDIDTYLGAGADFLGEISAMTPTATHIQGRYGGA